MGLMHLYDVGMSSMFVQEAFSLAELAQIIGRPSAVVKNLTARGNDMGTHCGKLVGPIGWNLYEHVPQWYFLPSHQPYILLCSNGSRRDGRAGCCNGNQLA